MRRQCTKNTYIKFKAGHATPFTRVLMAAAGAMREMYSERLRAANGGPCVVVFVARRPDRIVNPLILCTFLSSNVKWVFMGDSDSCKGSGCPRMDPSFFGGAGMTMLEWVSTPGFLEQVIRNEHVRRDIRTRISGW